MDNRLRLSFAPPYCFEEASASGAINRIAERLHLAVRRGLRGGTVA
jgi:hypothetical protein